MREKVKKNARSMLAIAAALNGTMPMPLDDPCLVETFVHTRPDEGCHGAHTGLKGWLEIEMEDFWHYNPVESSQFDREATLAFINCLSDEEVLPLLRAMGKAPDDDAFSDKWQAFVDALCAERFEDVAAMIEGSANWARKGVEPSPENGEVKETAGSE
jgi:hypothetical protein